MNLSFIFFIILINFSFYINAYSIIPQRSYNGIRPYYAASYERPYNQRLPFRLARRQIGSGLGGTLSSIVFPDDHSTAERIRLSTPSISHGPLPSFPQTPIKSSIAAIPDLLNFDLNDDDLDYFEMIPFTDRFGVKQDKCSSGQQQSPINIDSSSAIWKEYPPLKFSGHWNFKHRVVLFNDGHTAMLKEKGGTNHPKISGGPIGDETYVFDQLHFHWGADSYEGSEHTINSQNFNAEAHMVHYSKKYGTFKKAKQYKGGVLVLGYLFKASNDHNPELDDFLEAIPLISKFRNVTFSSANILSMFKQSAKSCYYHYIGSLTTGDCAEGVEWIIFNKTIPISTQQLNQFRRLHGTDGKSVRSNYRMVQRLNGRKVEFVSNDNKRPHTATNAQNIESGFGGYRKTPSGQYDTIRYGLDD